MPYGPTEYLIPYLLRRGQESKSVMREHLFAGELSAEIKSRINPLAGKSLGDLNIFKKKKMPEDESPKK